jgi:outer membrane receptor protein involved in Fe transport
LTIINGSQILDIPLHKQSLGLDWSPGGFETRIDAEHLDGYNGLNRPAYNYANGFVRYTAAGRSTFTFGVYNIFDTAALTYGQIGLGVFRAENQFGRDRNSFDEGVKLRGLTPRSFEFAVSERM